MTVGGILKLKCTTHDYDDGYVRKECSESYHDALFKLRKILE